MNVRSRRIRSGNFGALSQHRKVSNTNSVNSDRGGSILSVNRTFIPSTYDTYNKTVSIAFNMSYSIHNPDLLLSCAKKPLIILHGGPGIPSDYLNPLLKYMKDRSVILYDQIGCGRSSEPSDINAYSIDYAVDDLENLIRHLNLEQFHLCGHSFGGIIAFELVKRIAESVSENETSVQCQSLTLSSTPFDIHQVDQESEKILRSLSLQGQLSASEASSSFQRTFVCRSETIPSPLQQAYCKRGNVWQGTDAIQDYVAQEPEPTSLISMMPSVLLLRGEFDFVSPIQCLDNWKGLFDHAGATSCETSTLAGCSHYGMLEDSALYSKTLDSFLSEVEVDRRSV